MNAFVAINLFCAAAFLGYGATCLFSAHMVREFERYRLARFRTLTGVLQLVAAVGLLIGLQFPMIGALAAAGLAVQMLLGFGVRSACMRNPRSIWRLPWGAIRAGEHAATLGPEVANSEVAGRVVGARCRGSEIQ